MIFLDLSLSVSGTFDKSAGITVGCAIESLSETASSIIILFIIGKKKLEYVTKRVNYQSLNLILLDIINIIR